jgi:hypothetical protein
VRHWISLPYQNMIGINESSSTTQQPNSVFQRFNWAEICAPLAKLDEYFKMKEGSIHVPTFYLGAKLKKTVLPNGVVAWGMISSKYVQYTVHNVQEYLVALPGDHTLPKKASGPFTGGYTPEFDESPELNSIRSNFYLSRIGILRWCVELGRIGIITEVSMLSTHLCFMREVWDIS